MTLANLLAIQRLLAFNATPEGVQRLLDAAHAQPGRCTHCPAQSREPV